MKVKHFFLIMAVMAVTMCAQAQLKVLSDGSVSISNTLSVSPSITTGYITTNSLLSNSDWVKTYRPLYLYESKTKLNNFFRIELTTNASNAVDAIIGSSTDVIRFWVSDALGYNKLYAESYYTISDRQLKTNIFPLKDALKTLTAIKTYTYNYIEQEEKEKRTHYGVMAQELQELLPELVDTSHGYLLVNYNELIPLLINAVQDLNSEVQDLKKQLGDKGEAFPYKIGNGETGKMELQQNAPNPFTSATTIQGYIPQEIGKAQLCIYNMQGVQVKCLPVVNRGNVTITVAASQLAAGVYTYILIGDSKTSDAKQMILTK
jgi:hypothetical protein